MVFKCYHRNRTGIPAARSYRGALFQEVIQIELYFYASPHCELAAELMPLIEDTQDLHTEGDHEKLMFLERSSIISLTRAESSWTRFQCGSPA